MAKINTVIDVDVRGAEQVKTLMELLHQYQDQLPEDLKKSLDDLADCDAIEFGYDAFGDAGGDRCSIETDFHAGGQIISVNKILKRVKYNCSDDGYLEKVEYPEKFRLGSKGVVFVQWGYE